MEYDLDIFTDGACAGNPGIMGIGGRIIDNHSKVTLETFSITKGEGTNSFAEYMAIIEALKLVERLKGDFNTILLKSNSHLTISQLNGKCRIEEEVVEFHKKVFDIISSVKCNVDFMWIPYKKNIAACSLAYKAANMPITLIEGDNVIEWEEDKTFIQCLSEINSLPEVNKITKEQIEYINKTKGSNYSSFISLLTYGQDKYSRAKSDDLLRYIAIRFGNTAKNYLISTLEDLSNQYSKNVLRWVARGLRPDLATIKASIDIEIKENT